MGKMTFVLGGARSGKSSYALELAMDSGKKATFIATCPYYDEEMEERIQKHKDERPKDWGCFEEFKDVAKTLREIQEKHHYGVVLIDCITLFVSNLLLDEMDEPEIKVRVQDMIDEIKKAEFETILVSNEVGLGLIPENKLGRKFRDVAGRMNQLIAKHSDEVYFTVAGIPNKVKG